MWAGCGTYRYSIQEPEPDEYRCYLEESYGAFEWDTYTAQAAIYDFVSNTPVYSDPFILVRPRSSSFEDSKFVVSSTKVMSRAV